MRSEVDESGNTAKATIEVVWFGGENAVPIIEKALDALMARLLIAGVRDPGINVTLDGATFSDHRRDGEIEAT